jgi:hypothetical protein
LELVGLYVKVLFFFFFLQTWLFVLFFQGFFYLRWQAQYLSEDFILVFTKDFCK